MSKTLVLRPRLSEKTYAQSEARVYVVEVGSEVNKHSVARAIAEQFDVTVEKVNMTNIPGKSKRTMSLTGKRYLNSNGKRSDIKKAYVTLAKGDSLPFFAAVEEAEEKEQKLQEQVDKAAAKTASKDEKTTEKTTAKKPAAKKTAAKAEVPAPKAGRRGFLHFPGHKGQRGGDK